MSKNIKSQIDLNRQCKACGNSRLITISDFGKMPLMNAFLVPGEERNEKRFDLKLAWCPKCTLVQLASVVSPEALFTNYLYLTSASQPNISHSASLAHTLKRRFDIHSGTKILELGSNDATLLSEFRTFSDRLLGVDPAENLALQRCEKGIETITAFFSEDLAGRIVSSHGKFDLVVALNVVAHVADVIGFLRGVSRVLSPGGVFVMEVVYIRDTLLRGEFDTVYHEHVYYFSVLSILQVFSQAGLKVVDVEKVPTQGGSLRIYAAHEDRDSPPSEVLKQVIHEEKTIGLNAGELYRGLRVKFSQFRCSLRSLIEDVRKQDGPIAGLGASARGNVVLNFCDITRDSVPLLLDTTPLKQGKLSPGMHIPVASWDHIKPGQFSAFLMLSWTYEEYLLQALRKFVKKAKVIIPFPDIRVVDL